MNKYSRSHEMQARAGSRNFMAARTSAKENYEAARAQKKKPEKDS